MDNELYDIVDKLYEKYGKTHWIVNKAEHKPDGSWDLNIQLKPIEAPKPEAKPEQEAANDNDE